MEKISILGAGWLGLPLALSLKKDGYRVACSATTISKKDELKELAFLSSLVIVEPDSILCDDPTFFDTDLLIVNFPPKRVEGIETIYPAQMEQLRNFIQMHQVPKVLFVSSTSVYPENCGLVDESSTLIPDKPSGVACLAAEKVFQNTENCLTTIVRFGGLIGADRNPARFLLSTRNKGVGDKPVNLIHQDDCIGILKWIIRKEIWGEVFNGCSPEHPTREEFYSLASEISGLPLPQFEESTSANSKIVNVEKLMRETGYSFKYPSPMDYLLRND